MPDWIAALQAGTLEPRWMESLALTVADSGVGALQKQTQAEEGAWTLSVSVLHEVGTGADLLLGQTSVHVPTIFVRLPKPRISTTLNSWHWGVCRVRGSQV